LERVEEKPFAGLLCEVWRNTICIAYSVKEHHMQQYCKKSVEHHLN